MAENVEILDIDLSQLNEETEQTTKTLKDLREEVKNLREQLNNTTIGTEEFEKTLGDLEAKQKELASVTKSTNKAMEGSYDDLAQQMSALKKEWKATADVTERNEIGQKIKFLNDQLKSMDAEIGNFQRNVGNYGSALDGLRGSISDTAGATEGITHMFSSAVVVMNSMGLESDETAKILSRMQIAMTLTKGLKDLEKGKALYERLTKVVKGSAAAQKLLNSGIAQTTTETTALTGAMTADAAATTGATVATKAFRTALISTGIGAIVVAIGALIANFDKLTSLFRSNAEDADKYKDSLEGLNEQFDDLNNESERDIKLMKAKGAGLDEVHARQVQELKDEQALLLSKMRLIQADIVYLQNNRHWFDGGDKKIKNWTEEYNKLADAYKKLNKEIVELDANYKVDKQIEAINSQKKAYETAAAAAKTAREEYKKYLQLMETNRKKVVSLAEQAARATMSQREQDYADATLWAQDTLEEYQNMRREELKALQKARKQGLITEEEYNSKRTLIINRYSDIAANIQTVYTKKVHDLNEKYRKQEEDARKKAHEKKVKDIQDNYKAEMAVLDTEYNEMVAKYQLIDNQVGISQANEDFLKKQLEKLQAVRASLVALGEDVKEIDVLISDVILQQQEAFITTMQAKADSLTAITDQMSDTMSRITSIGEGLSGEWANVFSAMSTGIENVTKSLKSGEKGWRQYGTMAVAAMNVASSMMIALADEQDEQSKEGFEEQKKYQIAAATMSMLGGIISAWVSAMNPANAWMTIWGQLAAGTAMSAMIAATGIMQINKIKQQKFGGSTDTGASSPVAAPSMTALQSMNSGVEATTVIQGASTEGQVADTRVYVLESDITTTTQKVQVAQSEATF